MTFQNVKNLSMKLLKSCNNKKKIRDYKSKLCYKLQFMPSLFDEHDQIPKERLLTVITLIMIIEHKRLGLDEIVKVTGMSISDSLQSMQNLVNLRLVKVEPDITSIPFFELIDELEARNYLENSGVNPNTAYETVKN